MLHRRWRRQLGFLKLAIVLALLAAALAVAGGFFLRSFYSYAPEDFEPKDMPRGRHLERGGGS
jgi:hypothetical protein